MAVVVQPGFFVVILPLEAEGVVGLGVNALAVAGVAELAPSVVLAHPGELSVLAGNKL